MPIKIGPEIVVEVPVDQLCFRFLFRAITQICAFKVSVESPRETHIGAIVLRLTISVGAVIEVSPVAVVPELICESVAGAIIIVGLRWPVWISRRRIVSGKTSI